MGMPSPTRALLGIVLAGWLTANAVAADCEPWIARLVSAQGKVEFKPDGARRWLPTTLDQTFCFGDQIQVGGESRASIKLNNGTMLRLDQRSLLTPPEPRRETLSFVELLNGALHLLSSVATGSEVRTPFVNARLEGTEFVVRVDDAETIVSVIEGRVAVSNNSGRLRHDVLTCPASTHMRYVEDGHITQSHIEGAGHERGYLPVANLSERNADDEACGPAIRAPRCGVRAVLHGLERACSSLRDAPCLDPIAES